MATLINMLTVQKEAAISAGFFRLEVVRKGIKFQCQRCGKCCRAGLPIYLTPSEIETLRPPTMYTTNDGVAYIGGNGEPCIFMDNNSLCNQHHSKPTRCRCFPFHFDPLTRTLLVDRSCPGVGKGEPANISTLIAMHYRFFNELCLSTNVLLNTASMLYGHSIPTH
jgi:uncharacterized protein